MSEKRSKAKPKQPETGQTQENFNQLYTAHQVHTLAQFLFQRVSGPWNPMPNPTPFASQHTQPGMAWPMQQAPTAQPFVPNTPPGVIYWYP